MTAQRHDTDIVNFEERIRNVDQKFKLITERLFVWILKECCRKHIKAVQLEWGQFNLIKSKANG